MKGIIAKLIMITVFGSSSLATNIDSLQLLLSKLPLKNQLTHINGLSYNLIVSQSQKVIPILRKYESIATELNDKETLARIYDNLSLAYYYSGKYDENLKYGLKAIALYDSIGDKKKLGNMYGELGYQMKRRDLPKAFELMRRGKQILEDLKKIDPLSSLYNNYGVLHEMSYQLDSATFYYRMSLSAKRMLNDSLGIPYSLNNIAAVKQMQQQYDSALFYLHESTRIREIKNDAIGLAENYQQYGQVYAAKGNYSKSDEYFQMSLHLALKHGYVLLAQNLYKDLSKLHEEKGDYIKALNYYKLHKHFQDSIINLETNRTIADLQVRFETEEKEKALLEERAAKAQAELTASIRQKWIWGIMLLSGIVVLSILIVMQRNNRKAQEEKDKAVILEQEKGLAAIINAQEEERIRVAKELHDGVGQQIGAVSLNFQALAKKVGVITPELTPDFEKIKRMIHDTGSDIRSVSHQMMPKALTAFGLVDALEDMVDKSLTSIGVECKFEHRKMEERLPQTVEIGLFRIAQELVNNIIKHANATKVEINLVRNEQDCTLTIADNGRGFEDTKSDGIGMLSITSRVNALRGEFHIESEVGSGTRAIVRVKTH
jgi:signal transduction histidine kinase